MKRRLLNVLTVLSLLLCVAVAVLWVRSGWVSDAVLYGNGAGEYGVQSLRGVVVVAVTNRPHAPRTLRVDRFGALPPQSVPNRLGFGYRVQDVPLPPSSALDPPPVVHQRMLVVPLWFVVAVLGCLPACRFYVAYRRQRIRKLGLCARCGYDLRATPERCPECGEAAMP
jgi:hypothetical protein